MDNGERGASPPERLRDSTFVFLFDDVQFDESQYKLVVNGEPKEVEPLPLQLLSELLRRPDEVVTREELLDLIWHGRPTVKHVLANAIHKLRVALGPVGADRIVTVNRVGYRWKGSVKRTVKRTEQWQTSALGVGLPVPHRQDYTLVSALGSAKKSTSVWKARHVREESIRIFKFAADIEGLRDLKRELSISRFLQAELGTRDDLCAVTDFNLIEPPFFLAFNNLGDDLNVWSTRDLGPLSLPREERIALFLKVARAVESAHEIGVLHKDIKPSNILVRELPSGWAATVIDFGSARMLTKEPLARLDVSAMGTTLKDESLARGTTFNYAAPELFTLGSPTLQSDIYSLGVVLYQWLTADLSRKLSPGWEVELDDPLLIEDIRLATHVDLATRLKSVAELIARLTQLEQRRTDEVVRLEARRQAEQIQRQLEHASVRRHWLRATLASMSIGVAVAVWLYLGELSARRDSEVSAARADSINQFLVQDIIGQANPDGPMANQDPRLREVLVRAAQSIDVRFADDPRTAASVHRMMSEAFAGMGKFEPSQHHLRIAIALVSAQGETGARDALKLRYKLVAILLRAGNKDAAAKELKDADALRLRRNDADPVTAYHALAARGYSGIMNADVAGALEHLESAERIRASTLPNEIDELFSSRNRLSYCYTRLNRPEDALKSLDPLMDPALTPRLVGLGVWSRAQFNRAAALLSLKRHQQAAEQLRGALNALPGDVSLRHPIRAQLQAFLSSALVGLGNWDDAQPATALAYDLMVQAHGPESIHALAALANLGILQWRVGKALHATATLQRAYDGISKLHGALDPHSQAVAYYLAWSLLEAGDREADLRTLQALEPDKITNVEPDPFWDYRVALLLDTVKLQRNPTADRRSQAQNSLQKLVAAGASEDDVALMRRALTSVERRLSR